MRGLGEGKLIERGSGRSHGSHPHALVDIDPVLRHRPLTAGRSTWTVRCPTRPGKAHRAQRVLLRNATATAVYDRSTGWCGSDRPSIIACYGFSRPSCCASWSICIGVGRNAPSWPSDMLRAQRGPTGPTQAALREAQVALVEAQIRLGAYELRRGDELWRWSYEGPTRAKLSAEARSHSPNLTDSGRSAAWRRRFPRWATTRSSAPRRLPRPTPFGSRPPKSTVPAGPTMIASCKALRPIRTDVGLLELSDRVHEAIADMRSA